MNTAGEEYTPLVSHAFRIRSSREPSVSGALELGFTRSTWKNALESPFVQLEMAVGKPLSNAMFDETLQSPIRAATTPSRAHRLP